jgi:hypothetical protein
MMYKVLQIFQLISFNFLSILIAICAGQVFLFFFKFAKNYKVSIYELGLIGLIFIGFSSIFLNFFFSLSQFLNSVITLFFLSFLFIRNNLSLIFKNIKSIFFLSLLSSIIIIFSTVYAPDGSLYHIPYIKLLNDEKIIVGISNINFRFALNSIVQYISAFHYNFLFKEVGITIPLAIIPSFFIFFLLHKILLSNNFFKNHDFFYIFILFFFLISSIYSFSRYSEYGNDAVAHIYYLYLICLFLDYRNIKEKKFIYTTLIISIFLVANKLFFIFTFAIPLYLIIINKNYLFFKNKLFILSIFFILLVVFKNILISGCVFYPVKEFCFKSLYWTNIEEVYLQSLEGEAWAKGWVNQTQIQDFNEYSSNFNWLQSWYNVHFKVIIRKFFPIIIFILLFLFILKLSDLIFFKKRVIKPYLNKHLYFIFLFSVLNFTFWFYKFPLYRYGYSFINVFFIILFSILFFKIFKKVNIFYLKKIIIITITISFIGLFVKNSQRILISFYKEYLYYPWPNLVSMRLDNNYPSLKIVKVGDGFYYYSEDSACMYLKSPCSNYLKKNLEYKKIATYKIYYLNKL